MPRIPPVDLETASATTRKLLAGVETKLGMVPNLVATMAQSQAVAQAYLSSSEALSGAVLRAQLREQIAITVSQANQCSYCLAVHCAIGTSIGLSDDELRDALTATSPDRKTEAALKFARRIVERRGLVSADDIDEMHKAGYGDAEVIEVVAHVALSVFTNYVNLVAQTETDFPPLADIDS